MTVATDSLATRYAAVRQVMTGSAKARLDPRRVLQSDPGRRLGLC
jgi:hypothetical protein